MGQPQLVVIVENEPDLVRLFEFILRPYAVIRSYSSDFDRLLEPEVWEGVDAVLVDRVLGQEDVTGLSICSFVKANFPGIRVVMLTADTFGPSAEAGLVDVFLVKPQPIEAILSALGMVEP